MYGYTAAHRSIPLGTYVKVTNIRTNKTVVVKINDRGPKIKSRVLDLSYMAAKALGIEGIGYVKIDVDTSSILYDSNSFRNTQ
jgi:rare lipoprotein A